MDRRDYKLTDITTADKIEAGMIVSNHQTQPANFQGLRRVVAVEPSGFTDRKGRKLVRLILDAETGMGWVFEQDYALSVYTRKRGR